MKLYLLRHGDAVEAGDPNFKDVERPLTPKGIQRNSRTRCGRWKFPSTLLCPVR
jgi:phosphohistidine phosphatase SixA